MSDVDLHLIRRGIEKMGLWLDESFLHCPKCKLHVTNIDHFLKVGSIFAAAFEYGVGWAAHNQNNHPRNFGAAHQTATVGTTTSATYTHSTYTDEDQEDVPVEEL